MAHIRPFRGLRFAAADLAPLVAPPYDVLSPEERDELASRSAHNVVHLTLPEQKEDDRSKFVKYQRSNAALINWRNEGALSLEDEPAFYRYTQVFTIPGHPGRISRTSVIALIKTEPYEKGVVLPHEQTFPKHKADRLLILETTRAHLECIYGLFQDPDGSVLGLIQSAPTTSEISVTTDDGVEHLLEPITDPTACRQIAAAMEDKKVWIATISGTSFSLNSSPYSESLISNTPYGGTVEISAGTTYHLYECDGSSQTWVRRLNVSGTTVTVDAIEACSKDQDSTYTYRYFIGQIYIGKWGSDFALLTLSTGSVDNLSIYFGTTGPLTMGIYSDATLIGSIAPTYNFSAKSYPISGIASGKRLYIGVKNTSGGTRSFVIEELTVNVK